MRRLMLSCGARHLYLSELLIPPYVCCRSEDFLKRRCYPFSTEAFGLMHKIDTFDLFKRLPKEVRFLQPLPLCSSPFLTLFLF